MANNNSDLPRISEINAQIESNNNQAHQNNQGTNMYYSNPAQNSNMHYSNPPQNTYPQSNANMYYSAPPQNTYPQSNANMYCSAPAQNYEPKNEQYDYQPNAHSQDIEKGVENYVLMGGTNVDDMLKIGFIRKVYGILSFQLSITVAFTALTFIPSVSQFFLTNIWLFWTCLGLSLFIVIPLICFRDLSRTVPINYILMTLWTICESVMVATCCSYYDPQVVIMAGTLTAAVTISLTIYAFTTKTDFTFCGALLFVLICLMLFFGMFCFIFGRALHTFYCVLGVLVYSLYLIYDTQLVMGKYGTEYQIDDYIIAAIMIYIDIIHIFLYLLQLFGGKR